MIPRSIKTFSIGLVALAATAATASANGDPTGIWLDAAGRGAVEIAPCGEGSALCGRVVWVKSADHQKRCGEQILGSLKKVGTGTWGGGWIYSPDRGRKFDVEIKQVGADKLRILGWAGIRMFSETHYWKRAAPDLARCGSEQIASVETKSSPAAASPPSAAAAPAPSAEASTLPAAPASDGVPSRSAAKSAASDNAESAKPEPRRKSASRDDGLGDLPPVVEKYFKRSADGTCKVDTPWIKVKFDCKKL